MKPKACLAIIGLGVTACATNSDFTPNSDPSLRRSGVQVLDLDAPHPAGRLTATFLGNTTILITDGETNLLIDGFVTRPKCLFRLKPSKKIIDCVLRQAGIERVDAVIVGHAHHDHALDAPLIAGTRNARLIGSKSVANVGRGQHVPESLIDVICQEGGTVSVGDFTITMTETQHARYPPLGAFLHCLLDGKIKHPLRSPAPFYAFKTGVPFLIHIEHENGSVLVQTSAGVKPGSVNGLKAETVFLGLGALGHQSLDYQTGYFQTHIDRVGAELVVAVHWDDFQKPLPPPGEPLPINGKDRELDDAVRNLTRHPGTAKIHWPRAYERIVLPR